MIPAHLLALTATGYYKRLYSIFLVDRAESLKQILPCLLCISHTVIPLTIAEVVINNLIQIR
jgi:hypothetical protein